LSNEPSEEDAIPGQPANFGVVVPGVYRSSYPQDADYAFIQKLKLKTIVTLVDKEFPETFLPFMQANGIQHRHITMAGTKKEAIPVETMASILEVVHDKRNHPLLIHCNQGRVSHFPNPKIPNLKIIDLTSLKAPNWMCGGSHTQDAELGSGADPGRVQDLCLTKATRL
jgi:tyrosine-protein phosphatase SIW14